MLCHEFLATEEPLSNLALFIGGNRGQQLDAFSPLEGVILRLSQHSDTTDQDGGSDIRDFLGPQLACAECH
jgi:hypothetical protein